MSNQILLSLSGACLLLPLPRKSAPLELLDIPKFVAQELELRGLNIPVELIRGKSATTLEKLRDESDRAHCPCLILYQSEPLDVAGNPEGATQHLKNLGRAAKLLGCSELAVRVQCPVDRLLPVAATMKAALHEMQSLDVNLLIRPNLNPLDTAEFIMDLVKRIGGFHIGAMPSLEHAHHTGNPLETLRKLAPYSAAIEISSAGFTKQGASIGWDFDALIEGLISFGYLNKFSIDWTGTTNWVTGVQKTRERLLALMGREDPVA
ncbi:MAG: hypothetical protein EXS01_01310 [Phycisphaerales bacterium]|nr:hypothetical protein [Phycisphaerales bacterium]